jgi:hypothetical protein
MRRAMKVIKSVDKEGREVITYLKSDAPEQPKNTRRKKRNEAIRITLKLPR